ncbi:MAG: hypothetical protein HUJ27_15810 [Rhodobacteraceae bacterium]|nr:hypothetical protein [Paracoccaceae bacterium]
MFDQSPPDILDGRRLVFLQGPSSPFFGRVARACQALGAETLRIGFAPGDRLYWPARAGRYIAYRGRPEDFPGWLEKTLFAIDATDLVMLGDGRPYHRMAIDLLRGTPGGPTPWIVEQGYMRPDLIAIEPWGRGARSTIPKAFRQEIPSPPPALPSAPPADSFLRYGLLDMGYHLPNLFLGPLLYPHYRPYALDGPVREYAGWAAKALHRPLRRQMTVKAQARIAQHTGPIFLFPLQLATDFQLRRDGTGAPQEQVIDQVLTSFHAHAPKDALLVIKEHPLDNTLRPWWRAADRNEPSVFYLPSGDISVLLARVSGVVTINSTVGLAAILHGIPCHVLGRAIFDMPELTHSGDPDRFWTEPMTPDPAFAKRFAGFLMHYHVPGTFDGPGAKVGAENVAKRLARPFPTLTHRT